MAITLKAGLSAKIWLPTLALATAFGLSGPAAARSAADKRKAALRQALTSADVTARIVADGAEPLPSTPEEYAADIDREETKWAAIVKRSGAKAE